MDNPLFWHTVSSKILLDLPPWFSIVQDSIRLPSGKVVPDFYRIEAPDCVLITARREDGCILLERLFKQGTGRVILTSPAGAIEKGESPLEAAQRELYEETGYVAGRWKSIGSFLLDGNRGICTAHFFIAEEIQKVAEPVVDEMEQVEVVFLGNADIESAIRSGEIPLLPDVAILSLSLGGLHSSHV
jgi:ADP-ribose pyrophosphatase